PTRTITLAASSRNCCPVPAAAATMTPTVSTAMRSTATMRSCSFGPRMRREKLRSSATPSSTSTIFITTFSMGGAPGGSTQDLEDAALEVVLDLAAHGVRVGDVHDVQVEDLVVLRDVEGDRAGREVDERAQEEQLVVRLSVERDLHDPWLHVADGAHDVDGHP